MADTSESHIIDVHSDDIGDVSVDVTVVGENISLPMSDEMANGPSRKFRDMIRKRLLRQSAVYRQQETDSARSRMQLKRSDPAYREAERERDRERRRKARLTNPEQRRTERERDRLYKRRARGNATAAEPALTMVSHEIVAVEAPSDPPPPDSLTLEITIHELEDGSVRDSTW